MVHRMLFGGLIVVVVMVPLLAAAEPDDGDLLRSLNASDDEVVTALRSVISSPSPAEAIVGQLVALVSRRGERVQSVLREALMVHRDSVGEVAIRTLGAGKDPDLRANAARALRISGSQGILSRCALLLALGDETHEVANAACYGLELMRPPVQHELAELVVLLSEAHLMVHSAVIDEITRAVRSGVDISAHATALVERAGGSYGIPSANSFVALARALHETKRGVVAGAIIEAMATANWMGIRRAALEGLECLDRSRACHLLRAAVRDSDAEIRYEAGCRLVSHCPGHVLVEQLGCCDEAATRGVLSGLGLGGAPLSPSLVSAIRHLLAAESPVLAAEAARVLAMNVPYSNDIGGALRRCLASDAPLEARAAAADALSFVGDSAARGLFVSALTDESPIIVYIACEAVRKQQTRAADERVRALLQDLLASRFWEIRVSGARALSAAEPDRALCVLIGALESDDPRVRRDAATGLGELGARASEALPRLREALENAAPIDRAALEDAIRRITAR